MGIARWNYSSCWREDKSSQLEFCGKINRVLYKVPKLIDGNENSVDKKLTAT
ncbi:hypothetical protein ACP4OV_005775 [Aristida adscensionis]